MKLYFSSRIHSSKQGGPGSEFKAWDEAGARVQSQSGARAKVAAQKAAAVLAAYSETEGIAQIRARGKFKLNHSLTSFQN